MLIIAWDTPLPNPSPWQGEGQRGEVIGFAFKGFFCYIKCMPITQSAKKAIRGSLRKKAFNDQRKKVMKEIIKNIEKVVKTDKAEAAKMLSGAFQAIDKAAQKGVIKKNNAANKKSRLSKLIK
jgi:small subunit ribosomal protein S20